MKWDDAAKARLRAMDMMGYSSAEIAAEFGVTKNSVIGARNRMRHELGRRMATRGPERETVRAPKSRFQPVKIPEGAHPFVRLLYREMNRQRTSIPDVADRSGVSMNTIRTWRHSQPVLPNLEACFNVLGKTLVVKEAVE